MSAIVWSDVTGLAAELTVVDGGIRVLILAYVNSAGLDPTNIDGEDGPLTKLARIYLAAHVASGVGVGAAGATGGAVSSESAGGLSRSYSVPSMTAMASAWDSTDYGRRFGAIINNSLARLPFVI